MTPLRFVRLGQKTILLPTPAYLHLVDWVHHPADYWEVFEHCYPLPFVYRPLRWDETPRESDLIQWFSWEKGSTWVPMNELCETQFKFGTNEQHESVGRRTARPITHNGKLT